MKRVGLFVGIDKYKNGISQLQCAVNDAKSLSYEFAKSGYNVDFLQNEECSCDNITERILKSLEGLSAGDIFVFYFSGHGREVGGSHYLVGPSGHAEAGLFALGSLHFNTLLELTNKVPGLIRLFILDCCRSNILADRAGTCTCDSARDISLGNALGAHNNLPAVFPALVLSSCSSGEQALENHETKHGYFTEVLLKTIRDKNIRSFQQFQNSLSFLNTPKPQNVDWRGGNPAKWNQVQLFENWCPEQFTGTAVCGIPNQGKTYPKEYYVWEDLQRSVKTMVSELQGPVNTDLGNALTRAARAAENQDYSNAVSYLQEAEELVRAQQKEESLRNNPEYVEGLHRRGLDLAGTENEKKAFECYLKAAEFGHAGAMAETGAAYLDGNGVEMDLSEAVKWLRKGMESGSAKAASLLGYCYENGIGISKDCFQAVRCFEFSSEQKHPDGLYHLGRCYRNGDGGLVQNSEKADDLIRKAAELGSEEAKDFLAKQKAAFIAEQAGTDPFSGNAAPEITPAVKSNDENDPENCYNLGFRYYHGEGVKLSYIEAEKWFRRAAVQDHTEAQYLLAKCCFRRHDYSEAVKWFTRAAEKNHIEAQYSIGECYYFGNGVKQDYTEAVKWFRKAADTNLAEAQNYLGVCYYFGRGVKQDYDEASLWYQKAQENSGSNSKKDFLGGDVLR